MTDPRKAQIDRLAAFAKNQKELDAMKFSDSEEEEEKKTVAAPSKKKLEEDDDYDDDFDDDVDKQKSAKKAEEIKKQAAAEKAFKEHAEERKKSSAGRGTTLEAAQRERMQGDPELDDLWQKFRNFFNDINEETKEKIDLTENPERAARIRFTKNCERYGIMSKEKDQLSYLDFRRALVGCAFKNCPVPHEMKLVKLGKAIDAYNQETDKFFWRKFLEATYTHETTSLNGKFPKAKQKGKTWQEQEEEQKKKEEANKKNADKEAEEKKRQKEKEDKLNHLRGPEKESYKRETDEERKMRERKEELKAEEEKKEKEKLQKEISEKIRKAVSTYTRAIYQIKDVILAVDKDFRKVFRMYDQNKDYQVDFEELKKILSDQKVGFRDSDLRKVFKVLDKDKKGKVAHIVLAKMLDDPTSVDIKGFVETQIDAAGKWIDEESKQAAEEEEKDPVRSNLTTLNEGPRTYDNRVDIGTIDGMSEITRRTTVGEGPKVFDDQDQLRVYNELKELLKEKLPTFDIVLQKMDKPTIDTANSITVTDFEKVFNSIPEALKKYSNAQIRQVFNHYADRFGKISVKNFKELFYPSQPITKTAAEISMLDKSSNFDSRSNISHEVESIRSMHVDNIMQGKKQEDVDREKDQRERQKILQESKINQKHAPPMRSIMESREDDLKSDISAFSKPIDDIVGGQADPRQAKFSQMKTLKNSGGLNKSSLSGQALAQLPERQNLSMTPIVDGKLVPIDRLIDTMFANFCKKLVEEIQTSPANLTLATYVTRYGKASMNYLNFEEFKEIYMTHVYEPTQNAEGRDLSLDAKLKAIFRIFDTNSIGSIPRMAFEKIVLSNQPQNTILDRISKKLKKGGDRFTSVLREEFQEADMPFGSQGQLPLANLQTILHDYDITMLASDVKTLEEKGLVSVDDEKNKFCFYKKLLDEAKPKPVRKMVNIDQCVIRIQKLFRGYQTRKNLKEGRLVDLKGVGDQFGALAGQDRKPKQDPSKLKKDAKKPSKPEPKKPLAPPKAKKGTGKKKADTGVKRPEKQQKFIDDLTKYLKTEVFEHLIEKAFAVGESLVVSRSIQQNFQDRPVTKYVYPMKLEFQHNVMGVYPKTVQTLDKLGQIMFLDSENQLNQYDIATNKLIQSSNLGTRPPLKHYDIIDLVCDQNSFRIYTLNKNWILEIWMIEQSSSLPLKRLAVCNNDQQGKDLIQQYYKKTFNNSKPKFLSLQESNSQILVVNTSCVDGCLVFIDPISFSILKKINLKYSDFEIPRAVKDSILQLKQIFAQVFEKNPQYDTKDLFQNVITKKKQNEEIKLKEFVQRVTLLDGSMSEGDLWKVCRVLDQDGNGSISLQEFMYLLENVGKEKSSTRAHQLDDTEHAYDALWPEWVQQENKIDKAKELIGRMFDHLEKNEGIPAEAAFGMFDIKDKGYTSEDNFRKVLKSFFSEALTKEEEKDFIVKLAPKNYYDLSLDYRFFCRFLEKKFVRSFRANSVENSIMQDIDQMFRKEATLGYIVRKSAELRINLKRIFENNDQGELGVIPRNQFWRIIDQLPLGLSQKELQEVFDNDLQFDNYGNVDYRVIINSDIYVALERQILRTERRVDQQQQATDNRKVVVEDLLYIDDLELVIFTTVAPKSSTIWATSTRRSKIVPIQNHKNAMEKGLAKLDKQFEKDASKLSKSEQEKQKSEQAMFEYKLLGKFKGHRNQDPPSICYVPQSGCLISGEKHLNEQLYQPPGDTFPKADDPSKPINHKFMGSSEDHYERETRRNSQYSSEIIIWRLQKDMIELFQTRPPWNIPYYKRFTAHQQSIVDITYLQKAQLIVSCSTDQTIRFFDPVAKALDLTDPQNNPHCQERPGYFRPLVKEETKMNASFREQKRIYMGADSSCFALRALTLGSIHLDQKNPDFKSAIEWLVCLKLGKPQKIGKKNQQNGFLAGHGIERVKIQVPAIHHDDVVPVHVLQECEDLVASRRRRLISAFLNQLPHSIERIQSQVSLQASMIEKVRKLFLQSVLKRKNLKYVDPDPLREIYNIILKLPYRTKFENFLSTSGCSDKLSVSETFFYLQKFMQIHPLRTTQIEFDKSITVFQEKHKREFLRGTKRWPKQSLQKFANVVKQQGIDIAYLSKNKSEFVTREHFQKYVAEEIVQKFSSEEVDGVMNELDPFFTGIIQIQLIQSYFQEEIHYYNVTCLNRPKEILGEIRSKVFPNKKLALQQALVSVDEHGDGLIGCNQFVDAFIKAGVEMNRELLEQLFEILGEKYSEKGDKFLSITYFVGKIFSESERKEISQIDLAISKIKTCLIYKGLDFSILFAEHEQTEKKSKRSYASQHTQKQEQEQKFDPTLHYTSFSQQLVKEEFIERVMALKCKNLERYQAEQVASFLSLNQLNQMAVYLNSWLHHLQRVSTDFHKTSQQILPIACSKILRNEQVFRYHLEQTCDLRQAREEEKMIEPADLRYVLKHFGFTYPSQSAFIEQICKNGQVHIEDLISRMKSIVKQTYGVATYAQNHETEAQELNDLKSTDYFDKIQTRIRTAANGIDGLDLIRRLKQFDPTDSGKIAVYHLINTLQHNYGHIFDDDLLVGLQFELETLDQQVDYYQFMKLFIEGKQQEGKQGLDIRKKQAGGFTLVEYELLLAKLQKHVVEADINLMHMFKIYQEDGQLSYKRLEKIFDLIEFPYTEQDFRLMTSFADEDGNGTISYQEFALAVQNAEQVAPVFDMNKWIVASRELEGRFDLLEHVNRDLDLLMDMLNTQSEEGKHSGIIAGEEFGQLLRDAKLDLYEREIDLVTFFAIRGSRRANSHTSQTPQLNIKTDLINFNSFTRAIENVIKSMRQEEYDNERKREQEELLDEEVLRMRKEMEEKEKEYERMFTSQDPVQRGKETALRNKIVDIFMERDVSFFDAFQSYYDPLSKDKSLINMIKFKKGVNSLNLPLSVQEHRTLRKIADPHSDSQVDLHRFCSLFETEPLRKRRLGGILDKVATAFYIQDYDLRKAFSLFDANGNGMIDPHEFRSGWLTLDLGLSYDEISDLFKLVDKDGDGQISAEEFITRMEKNQESQKSRIQGNAEEILFSKIVSLVKHHSETITQLMSQFDFENTGYVDASSIPRVIKRLGILHPEKHMPEIMKAGGSSEREEKIDYITFCHNLINYAEQVVKQKDKLMHSLLGKIYALLQSKDISFFEFFCMLDVNKSSKLSKVELKTGIQTLGIPIQGSQFELMWKRMKKKEKTLRKAQEMDESASEISYIEMLQAFINAGCLRIQKAQMNTDNIVAKFRKELKRRNISIEKAFKAYDPEEHGFAFKKDFINETLMLGVEMSQDELYAVFDFLCGEGEKIRFTFKQLHDTVLLARDEKWLFNSYIKIHGLVLQKNLSYRRLFNLWKEKGSKSGNFRLNQKELRTGLKKLRAGLTTDEIEKLLGNVPFGGKDNTISADDFKAQVISGAKMLQQEKAYEKLLIQDWITRFNSKLDQEHIPIEKIFQEHDMTRRGALDFDEFYRMNTELDIDITKREQKRIFEKLDSTKNGTLRIDELKNVASIIQPESEENFAAQEEEDKTGSAANELDDLYSQLKSKLESKNSNLETIVFNTLKFMPLQLMNPKGCQQIFEKAGRKISKDEALEVIKDFRSSIERFDGSYRDFVEYMTKRKVNAAFLEKGFVDPIVATCCHQVAKIAQVYEISFREMFDIFDRNGDRNVDQKIMLKCLQGLQLTVPIEDLQEFYNYLDRNSESKVSRDQFVDAITFITSKVGGSKQNQALTKGVNQTQKGHSIRQQVDLHLAQIVDAFQAKRYTMRQTIALLDTEKTGFISRQDLAMILRQVESGLSLEHTRMVMNFFDDQNTGKVSVITFMDQLQDIASAKTGGGDIYSQMQVEPIVRKIVDQLAIDCGKFFDELADLNEQLILEQEDEPNNAIQQQRKIVGLSKQLFYRQLNKYGVLLDEDEITLINQVFRLKNNASQFDYIKMDNMFEAVQATHFKKSQFYTKEWECRVFKRIGNYLRAHGMTINQAFDQIDEDGSGTISLQELKNALVRMKLDMSDKELRMFLSNLSEEGQEFITQSKFLRRFWSAYTYDNVFAAADGEKMSKAPMSEEVKKLRMVMSIQERIKKQMSAPDAFQALDTKKVSMLTMKDFQKSLPVHFGLSLKRQDVIKFFQTVDGDKDGILLYKEFEDFYNHNYEDDIANLEKKRDVVDIQVLVFEHLTKVLKQKNLSLAEAFEQIDLNQNGFIDVEEFQNMLQRFGYTITEEQVYEMMRRIDENFDGRISYKELSNQVRALGLAGKGEVVPVTDPENFQWRDKAIEKLIRAIHQSLNKTPFEKFFEKFDKDHDGKLRPEEFRRAMLSLQGADSLKPFQIDRILHTLKENKQVQPLVAIERLCKFLRSYEYKDQGEQGSTLIDQDLFVYIIEKYDGFSRLVEQISQNEEKASYHQRHVNELNLRGLTLMANQKTVQKLKKKQIELNDLYESTLVLLTGEAGRLMREEAQLCTLDPTHNTNQIVSNQHSGVVQAIEIPILDNTQFDIDQSTLEPMACGAEKYQAFMPHLKKKVEVFLYPTDDLNFVSSDGKSFKKHIELQIQAQRYMMGAVQTQIEGQNQKQEKLIFENLGQFEKKIGMSDKDKDVYVINEQVNEDEWISLSEYVQENGGLLNIPLFYHTNAPLFIIRHWANKIFEIVQKLHSMSLVARTLDLEQLYISRDGQTLRLKHLNGVGKVNNLGKLSICPDIYLSLDSSTNIEDNKNSSSRGSFRKGGASSSKKTDTEKKFHNRSLDSPFLAPEALFSKFSEHTAAMDVWSVGMILFTLLFGKKPESFYQAYRKWLKTAYGKDVEFSKLPFTPPSQANFNYDPFTFDFDNSLTQLDQEAAMNIGLAGSLHEKKQKVNFENCMKCIKDLSYSALFKQENSKKFSFKPIQTDDKKVPAFPGQEADMDQVRRRILEGFANAEILARKNELGLILDIISSCIDVDPKNRPTIQGLLASPLFQLDKYELTNAERFSQNAILYRSPQAAVSLRITEPLRIISGIAIDSPKNLLNIETDILQMFHYTEDCLKHISSLPIEEINAVLTEQEKKRSMLNLDPKKDAHSLSVSPNTPLAAQLISDKVIDMLILVTLRHFKVFQEWKKNQLENPNMQQTQGILKQKEELKSMKSVKFSEAGTAFDQQSIKTTQSAKERKQQHRLKNQILPRMCQLLKTLVYEMHSYSTPMSPFAKEVIEYIMKMFVGEEYELGSDQVLRVTSGLDNTLRDYLRGRSFCRRENELNAQFKSDRTDKLWFLDQKNRNFLDKSNYWCPELHKEILPIYKDAVTESGMGQSCYPVLNDYITNTTNSFEPNEIFSKQMNSLCLSFLIPSNRTAAYYNELIPLTECLSRLSDPNLQKAGKRCALAVIRSVFQTGNSDKIKACLDMRIPKQIIHFLQDSDSEVRHETLLIFFEISKGLQDEDSEILGRHATNLRQEMSKAKHSQSTFDQHKAMSMQSQQVEVPPKPSAGKANMDAYIKRTTALIEQKDNDKYVNFALDLPNLNFIANKRFLREMATCFQSPVFIAPLIRLLKTPTESFSNKEAIIQILENLFCGDDKVMAALASPACDTYMTLLKYLMSNTKVENQRRNMSGLTAQMRNSLALQDKIIRLFTFMFDQRRPQILQELSCIGAASTLLKEQNLQIPHLVSLPTIVEYVDALEEIGDDLHASQIYVDEFMSMVKDLRCWIKYSLSSSPIPELIKMKAIRRCLNLILKVTKLCWNDYERLEVERNEADTTTKDGKKEYHKFSERMSDLLVLIKYNLALVDWLCNRGQESYIFNEEYGERNLNLVLELCNNALSVFRRPTMHKSRMPMEELAHNKTQNLDAQLEKRFYTFPFTPVSATLQNILYQLVRADKPFLNRLLSEANYGFIFGEQLILDYEFIRHSIDHRIESMVLIDSYVKKNEIRLNTFEHLLRSSEHTLKTQFIKSNFFEKMFAEYISDFREFNIQFSKIDLEFLAFRKTFPLRLEAISLLNTALLNKQRAPSVFTEAVMYARRHFLVRNEVALLRQGRMSNKEQTALLLFSVLLESNEEDLIYVMMQEGVHRTVRDLIKEFPSLNKRFPALATYTNKF